MATAQCHQSLTMGVTRLVNRDETERRSPGLTTTESLPDTPTWAQEWLNEKAAQGLTAASLYRYGHDLKILDLDISKSTIIEIKAKLAACSTKYGRGSLRHVCIATKQVLRQLGRESDAKLIKLPKRPEPRVVTYSPEDYQSLLAGCTNLRDRLLFEVLAETGARRGELFNMRIKDVRPVLSNRLVAWKNRNTNTKDLRRLS